MAEGNGNGEGRSDTAPLPQGGPPMLNALAQYLKDFSFENPNAPRSLGPQEKQPAIAIQVNVRFKALSGSDFEVSLTLDAKAGEEGNNLLFKLDLEYAGVFRLTNIPQEQVHPILMIECPRLLFPFVRQIVADATRDGGFPPLYIDPIDFVGLYQQQVQAAAAGQPAQA
ncbi:MAG TPA: protein-export chaperone SecB [Methylocystis sp.]|nr:protein-export chaperone SecB [Methylocystis sp.]